LLRAILEIETYYRIVDKDKLKKDFEKSQAKLSKAILIFDNTKPMKPFSDTNGKENYKYVFKLLDEFAIDVYELNLNSEKPKINKIYPKK
jgi:hypothetical protein